VKIFCPYGCGARFDDEFRTTVCPHETFAANDGRNNFAHHPGSVLTPGTANKQPKSSDATQDCKVKPC
jgi:hypothetical protein